MSGQAGQAISQRASLGRPRGERIQSEIRKRCIVKLSFRHNRPGTQSVGGSCSDVEGRLGYTKSALWPIPRASRLDAARYWRSIADWRGRRRPEATGVHRRNRLRRSGLRPTASGAARGENGALAFGKAPVPATFRPIFAHFLGVF